MYIYIYIYMYIYSVMEPYMCIYIYIYIYTHTTLYWNQPGTISCASATSAGTVTEQFPDHPNP